jgi:hypothetical protein
MGSTTFQISQSMLQVDEETTQKPLKDVEQLDLVLSKIPTKELYKLQMSMAQEVQSRARMDATNLETTKEEKEVLETVLKEVQIEHEEEKQCTDKLEQRLEEVFQTIPDNALAGELNTEEKIKRIAQMMEGYKQEIVELVGKLTPTTPPEVRSEREQQETEQTDSIALEVKEIAELYERTTQIWTSLEEDEGIQQLDQREEKLNVAVQD